MKIIKKTTFIILVSLISLLIIIGYLNNPLSDNIIDYKNPELINQHSMNISFDFNELEFDSDSFWEDEYLENGEMYRKSSQLFLNLNNQKRVYFIEDKNSQIICENNEYLVKNSSYQSKYECINKSYIKNPNIHPIKPLSFIDSNYMLLGTIPNNQYDIGLDRLSYLSKSFSNTFTLSLLSLISFLIFSLYFSITIGYYNNKYRYLSIINQTIIKAFECVPILLWILILIIILGSFKNFSPSLKINMYFIFFGLFSSPALSKLLIEKINQLKNEDFIVALKLLGLSDFRIIKSHILKHFCLPIIFFQIAYIMAHAFFLDLTLSFIEQGNKSNLTLGHYIYESYANVYFENNFNLVVILSYSIIYIFYYFATIFKDKAT